MEKILDGKAVSDKELQEAKEIEEKGKRIIEIKPGEFKTLSKMNG